MSEKIVDLETILKKHFGCKSPFLKNPIVVDQGIEWKHYRYISRNGDKAYAKLVELIYDLEKLLPEIRHGRRMFSAAVRVGSREKFWNTNPIFRFRTNARASLLREPTSCPSRKY